MSKEEFITTTELRINYYYWLGSFIVGKIAYEHYPEKDGFLIRWVK